MSQRKHRHRSRRSHDGFFYTYRLELGSFVLFAAGVFLLVEELEIKETIWAWLTAVFGTVFGFVDRVVGTVWQIRGSDLVGIALILTALYLSLVRLRYHLLANHGRLDECPQCGSSLERVHRSAIHHLAQTVLRLKLRRYACLGCDWKGIAVTRDTASSGGP